MSEFLPYVTVVIATYNRVKILRGCLDTLSEQTYPKNNYEVIIVNDGSKDETEQFLGNYQKTAKFTLRFYTQENAGQAKAVNLGIEKAKGEIVCFTDDDCLADKDWLTNLVAGYTTEEIGCVGGLILSYSPKSLLERYIDRKKFLTQGNFMVCGPVIGANTSYRKRILEVVGGFDPGLPIGLDGDLGIRVRLSGYKFYYAKDAVIYHKHRTTLNGLLKWQYDYGSVVRMNKKYTRYFKPFRSFFTLPAKIALTLFKIPLRIITAPLAEEKDYHAAEHIIDLLVYCAQLGGLVHETFFGRPYDGEVYPMKIDFMVEQTFSSEAGKLLRRIIRC